MPGDVEGGAVVGLAQEALAAGVVGELGGVVRALDGLEELVGSPRVGLGVAVDGAFGEVAVGIPGVVVAADIGRRVRPGSAGAGVGVGGGGSVFDAFGEVAVGAVVVGVLVGLIAFAWGASVAGVDGVGFDEALAGVVAVALAPAISVEGGGAVGDVAVGVVTELVARYHSPGDSGGGRPGLGGLEPLVNVVGPILGEPGLPARLGPVGRRAWAGAVVVSEGTDVVGRAAKPCRLTDRVVFGRHGLGGEPADDDELYTRGGRRTAGETPGQRTPTTWPDSRPGLWNRRLQVRVLPPSQLLPGQAQGAGPIRRSSCCT